MSGVSYQKYMEWLRNQACELPKMNDFEVAKLLSTAAKKQDQK